MQYEIMPRKELTSKMEGLEGNKAPEEPELGRCCFCIPLREGVLAYTYITLIYHIALLALAFLISGVIAVFSGMGSGLQPIEYLFFVPLPLLCCLVAQNLLAITFVHLTHTKGIKSAISFGTVLLVITILICIFLGYFLFDGSYGPDGYDWKIMSIIVLEPFLQGCGLVLIGSLLLKLRGDGNVQYVPF